VNDQKFASGMPWGRVDDLAGRPPHQLAVTSPRCDEWCLAHHLRRSEHGVCNMTNGDMLALVLAIGVIVAASFGLLR
jgi:hypothetical protein